MNIPEVQQIMSLILVGTAWAFLRADPRSDTSAALAFALAMGGLDFICNWKTLALLNEGPLPSWAGLLVIPEVLAFCAAFEWVLRVRRTIPAGALRTVFGDGVLRVAQGLAVLYGVNAMLMPELRIRDFFGGMEGAGLWTVEVFRLFVAPLGLAMLLWVLSIVLCLNRDPEPAERVRLVAMLIAVPLMSVSLVLPQTVSPATTLLGLVVLLSGALRHAQIKGRQAQFMSRFLSPQVATLVNRDGLRAAMREERRELSIVCVDLRHFSAFASAHDSSAVIELLREYYDAVGAAVLEFEGTVKDYAGDGVLILLGAPVAVDDHAHRAVALARRIIEYVTPLLERHGTAERPLGIGAAVASGPVAVGVIGGEGPLEYAAVGAAVNLASRLCEQAKTGEVLIAASTRALLEGDALPARCEAREPIVLKGFAAPVEHFALAG